LSAHPAVLVVLALGVVVVDFVRAHPHPVSEMRVALAIDTHVARNHVSFIPIFRQSF
jgi:hypothetical protein